MKCPKQGNRPTCILLEGEVDNCFSWNMLQISHPFLPPQKREQVQNGIQTQIKQANMHFTTQHILPTTEH